MYVPVFVLEYCYQDHHSSLSNFQIMADRQDQLDDLNQQIKKLEEKIEEQNDVILTLNLKVNSLTEGRDNNTQETESSPKPRGGIRKKTYNMEEPLTHKCKSSYRPYQRKPNDEAPLKRGKHPHVTLDYEHESIAVCNQWIRAQVCGAFFLFV